MNPLNLEFIRLKEKNLHGCKKILLKIVELIVLVPMRLFLNTNESRLTISFRLHLPYSMDFPHWVLFPSNWDELVFEPVRHC